MKIRNIRDKIFINIILIILIIVTLDLYSKYKIFYILDNINVKYPYIEITSFFNLVKVWNSGISFGMLNAIEYAKYIILFANVVILTILFFLLLNKKTSNYNCYAFSFIIGGGLGNLTDRIINGAVADFLDFHIHNYHWPAFNIADSCVFIGVILLLFENFLTKKKNENNSSTNNST